MSMFNLVTGTLGSCQLLTATSRALFHTTASLGKARRWRQKTEPPFQSELRNPVSVVYGGDNLRDDECGVVYDTKPFKVAVKKYHVYDWCGCGLSRSQPFCDGTHLNQQLRNLISCGPIRYIAPEDRDVWFCNCKQTKHRPFCDGTHRSEEVQETELDYKMEIWEPKDKKSS